MPAGPKQVIPDFVEQASRIVEEEERKIPRVTQQQAARIDIHGIERANSRKMVAKSVTFVYIGTLIVLGILAIIRSLRGDAEQAQQSMIDVLKTGVLPIVTLVIGYYMGRQND